VVVCFAGWAAAAVRLATGSVAVGSVSASVSGVNCTHLSVWPVEGSPAIVWCRWWAAVAAAVAAAAVGRSELPVPFEHAVNKL
jgi:hypothetical protein